MWRSRLASRSYVYQFSGLRFNALDTLLQGLEYTAGNWMCERRRMDGDCCKLCEKAATDVTHFCVNNARTLWKSEMCFVKAQLTKGRYHRRTSHFACTSLREVIGMAGRGGRGRGRGRGGTHADPAPQPNDDEGVVDMADVAAPAVLNAPAAAHPVAAGQAQPQAAVPAPVPAPPAPMPMDGVMGAQPAPAGPFAPMVGVAPPPPLAGPGGQQYMWFPVPQGMHPQQLYPWFVPGQQPAQAAVPQPLSWELTESDFISINKMFPQSAASFSGDKPDLLEGFLTECSRRFATTHNEVRKINIVRVRTDGAARDWVEKFVENNDPSTTTFATFRSAIMSRFLHHSSLQTALVGIVKCVSSFCKDVDGRVSEMLKHFETVDRNDGVINDIVKIELLLLSLPAKFGEHVRPADLKEFSAVVDLVGKINSNLADSSLTAFAATRAAANSTSTEGPPYKKPHSNPHVPSQASNPNLTKIGTHKPPWAPHTPQQAATTPARPPNDPRAPPPPFDGNCRRCQAYGHRQRDCPN